jgi:hypothetical protein
MSGEARDPVCGMLVNELPQDPEKLKPSLTRLLPRSEKL